MTTTSATPVMIEPGDLIPNKVTVVLAVASDRLRFTRSLEGHRDPELRYVADKLTASSVSRGHRGWVCEEVKIRGHHIDDEFWMRAALHHQPERPAGPGDRYVALRPPWLAVVIDDHRPTCTGPTCSPAPPEEGPEPR